LLELGHRRLAHIAGPTELDTARRRMEGFVAAAVAGGASPAVVEVPFEERGGSDAIRRLLAGDRPPTGVFVSNINQAIGALAGARAAGRAVPGEISVIGYDDDEVADYLDPPLTAIRMPLHELGEAAVDALLEQLEGGGPRDIEVRTPPALVPRASTGRAPE